MSDAKKDIKKPGLGKILLSAGGLAIMLAVIVLVNVIFSYASLRWDLTEDQVYSLSNGTKTILSTLEDEVTIKVFYNKSLPSLPVNIKTYAQRAIEFVNEYVQYGKGKVNVEIYDPKADSDEEEWAQKYGLQSVNMPTGEKIFLGVVVMSSDQEEAIPFLDPSREALLEYDLTRLITRVQHSKKKLIGIISTLPVFGSPPMPMQAQQNPSEPWTFVTELKKTYNVREIAVTEDKIDNDVDVLLILHPKDLSEKLQYAIDQYVLSGKNAVVFVDPMCVSDQSPAQNQYMRNNSSSLDKLFKTWGITMDKSKVIADMYFTTRVRTQNNNVESNPVWMSVKDDGLNKDNVVTSSLETLLFPAVGSIKKASDSPYTFETLVQSSVQASLVDSFKANMGAENIRKDFTASSEKFGIAVQVQGKFKTAFPGGPPKDETPEQNNNKDSKQPEPLKEAKDKATVIVIADADMLYDAYYVQKQNFLGFQMANMFNDNLNLLLNSCETLTGSQELISIRSRGKFERPFIKVAELERNAQERWRAKEQELIRQAENTNRRLQELQQQKDPSQKMIVSPEQESEIQEFKSQKLKVNKELKIVRRSLRADIESLGVWLKFINIFFMPLLIAIGGILFAVHRQNKAFKKE